MIDPLMQQQTETVRAECPNCGDQVEDLDGFGVLIHDACGYCSHPDIYGDVCINCGTTYERRNLAAMREWAGRKQGEPESGGACPHNWRIDLTFPVMDTYPPIYTWRCTICDETEAAKEPGP